MKIGFLGFDQFCGKFNIGSSRIRCDWLINYWKDSERYKMGKKYDAIIFQKAYFIDFMKKFDGIKILDLCDPDWLDFKSRVVETIEEVDGITCSSPAIAQYIKGLTDKPVIVVEDGVDLNLHKEKKLHLKTAETVVWFGYSHNFPVLDQVIKLLVDLDLELIVISNGAYHPPANFATKLNLTNIFYDSETINKDLLKGDIVINPRLSSNRFKYKSNNKTITAWALGLPVANDDVELKRFIDPIERTKEAEKRYKEVVEKYDVVNSVVKFQIFIKLLEDGKIKKHDL